MGGSTKVRVHETNGTGANNERSEGEYEMRLVSVKDETAYGEVKRFVFTTSAPLFPGHAVTFINKQKNIERDYSLIDATLWKGKLHLHFIIKIYPGGEMTQWLKTLTEGDVVWL